MLVSNFFLSITFSRIIISDERQVTILLLRPYKIQKTLLSYPGS